MQSAKTHVRPIRVVIDNFNKWERTMRLFGPNINKALQSKDLAGLTEALQHKKASTRRAAATALGQLGNTEALVPLLHAFVKEPENSVREAILKSLTALFTGQALNPMVHALADKNYKVQILASKLLAQVNYQATKTAFRSLLDDKAVDILISSLDHRDIDVTNASANILSVMGNRSFPKLIAALQDDRNRTGNVARILGWTKNPNAIEPLTKVLGYNTTASSAAVEALEGFGDQAIPFLRTTMHSGNEKARKNAISVLQKVGDTELIEPLSKSLDDKGTCYEAALALANYGQPAFSILSRALEDKTHPWKREAACKGLGDLGILEAFPALMLALDDENNKVRAEAALALGNLKQSDAIPSLLLALGDRDYSVAGNAGKALENLNEQQLAKAIEDVKHGRPENIIKLNDSRAIPALLSMLGNNSKDIRDNVIKVLNKLGESTFAKAFIEALEMKPESLINLGDKRAIQPLLQLILQGGTNEREAAALTLGTWSGDGFNTLVKLVDTENSSVKLAVIYGLGQSGEESALTYLLNEIKEQISTLVPRYPTQAIEALGFLGNSRATSTLINLLEDQSQAHRWRAEAATALGRLGDMSAFDALMVAAKDENSGVRENAILAIMQLSPDDAWELAQEEQTSKVRQTIFQAYTPGQLVGYFNQTNNKTIVQDIIIVMLSSEEIKQEIIDQAGAMSKIKKNIIFQFEGEVWNKIAANHLVKLMPESAITVEMINWMDKALGYEKKYSGARYEYGELDITAGTSAIQALCAVNSSATSNLLRIVSNKKDLSVTLDKGCGDPITRQLDFSSQRQLALTELEKRGNPTFDIYNFTDGQVSDIDIQQGEALIKKQVYQGLLERATNPNYQFRTNSDPMSAYGELVRDHPTPEVLHIIVSDITNRKQIQTSDLRAFQNLLIEGGKALPIEQAMKYIRPLQSPWPQAYKAIENALALQTDS